MPDHIFVKGRSGPQQLTADVVFELYKDNSYVHFLKAWYDQMVEIMGKKEADEEFNEKALVELHLDRNYLTFIASTGRSKKPVTKRVVNIYRTQAPDGKEYIIWNGQLRGESKMGEPMETSVNSQGFVEIPQFRQKYDKESQEYLPTLEVVRTKPLYLIEWNKKNIEKLSDGFYDDGTIEKVVSKTRFYFIDGSNKKQATPKGWSEEAWIEAWKTMPRAELSKKLNETANSDHTNAINALIDAIKGKQ